MVPQQTPVASIQFIFFKLPELGLRPLFGLFYEPRVVDDCRAVGGIIIGTRNRTTPKKPAPMLLCPPQIIHDLTWDRTRAAAVGSRRLIARTMIRLNRLLIYWPSIRNCTPLESWALEVSLNNLSRARCYCLYTSIITPIASKGPMFL
jgi:hypothetical protein